MRLLLDTHIWLWSVLQPKRIDRVVQRQLVDPRNSLHLSPISVWEAECLCQKGTIRVKPNFHEWLDETMQTWPLTEVPYTISIAREASRLRLPQPDFGDIMLAATAVVESLVLVTADRQLLECKWLRTLANE